jgi:hypothetical protein
MTDCIADPLSLAEATVLRAYAEQTPPAAVDPHERAEVALATQALIERGMLVRVDRGILVTPEGLALALDAAGVMRMASPPGGSSAGRPGAATRPSKAPRTSAGSSSRRAQAPN